LTAANHQAVAALCRRLDGLPLALELAAARSKVLAPQEILAFLQRSDGEHGAMLDLLTSRTRDLPDRQRTLRSAIAWSYALLEPVERRVLRTLAVFAGGCTLAAATAVCCTLQTITPHAVLEVLASLVEKNLLLMQEGDDGPATGTRYTMLQTIREFVLAELAAAGEEEEARVAHARDLLAQATAAARQLATLPQLDADFDNIRAALTWLTQQVETAGEVGSPHELLALQLAGALRPFWLRREHDREGRRWCERLLAAHSRRPVDEQPADPVYLAALAQVYGASGDMAWLHTDHDAAVICHRHCLDLSRRCDDQAGAAFALNNLGVQATDVGDIAEALALLTEGLHLAQQIDNGPITVAALSNLALLYLNSGDLAAAQQYGDAALAAAVVLDDDYQLAIVLLNLGDALRLQGGTVRAVALLERCIALAARTGMQMVEAVALPVLAKIEVQSRDWQTAAAHLYHALRLAQQLHRPNVVAECLEVLAALAVQTAAPLTAARLYGAAQQVRATYGHPRAAVDDPDYAHQVDQLRTMLAPVVLAQQWAGGLALTLEAACAYALDAIGTMPAPGGRTSDHD
jgi:tetratricopeptide (TPR) repeat protein